MIINVACFRFQIRMKCLICPQKGRIRFPKNDRKRKQWASILRCSQLLPAMKDPRLCENHFKIEDCFINSHGQLRLRPGSLPEEEIDNRSDHDVLWISSSKTTHHVHKCLIAAVSFLLEEIMMDTDLACLEEHCIITPDYDEEDVCSVLDLLYSGQTILTQKKISNIKEILTDLEVYDDLMREIECIKINEDEGSNTDTADTEDEETLTDNSKDVDVGEEYFHKSDTTDTANSEDEMLRSDTNNDVNVEYVKDNTIHLPGPSSHQCPQCQFKFDYITELEHHLSSCEVTIHEIPNSDSSFNIPSSSVDTNVNDVNNGNGRSIKTANVSTIKGNVSNVYVRFVQTYYSSYSNAFPESCTEDLIQKLRDVYQLLRSSADPSLRNFQEEYEKDKRQISMKNDDCFSQEEVISSSSTKKIELKQILDECGINQHC